MAGFFQKVASYGGMGGLPGAYSTNKNFRNSANEFLFGSDSQMNPYNQKSLSTLQGLLQGGGLENNELYGAGSDFLKNILSGNTQQFEAPLMQNFQQRIAPGIAERFAGMGTGAGASSSSALYNSLSQAGSDLQTSLGALRGGLQMQAAPQALQYAQSPIMNMLQSAGLIPGQYYETPGQEGLVQGGVKAFAGGFGKALGGG